MIGGLVMFLGFAGLLAMIVMVVLTILYMIYKLPPPLNPRAIQWRKQIFGHRGVRMKGIPENTLSAFKYAADRGAFGIELDVFLTKDGEVVVIHDNECSKLTTGTGLISNMTLKEVQQLTFRNIDDAHRNEKVPLLKDCLQFCKERNLKVLIEIKPFLRTKELVDKILAMIYELRMDNQINIISFWPISLYYVRQRDRNLETCICWSDDMISWCVDKGILPKYFRPIAPILDYAVVYASQFVLPFFLGCSMVGPDVNNVHSRLIKYLHDRNISVYCWTVNDDPTKYYLKHKGVIACTDYNFDKELEESEEKER